MKNNISAPDRYLRLMTGLMAYGSASAMRRGSVGKSILMAFGAMKVAEGVTGWCPVTELVERLNRTESRDFQHSNPAAQPSARRRSDGDRREPEDGRNLKTQKRSDYDRQS
ncbi:MAG: DUF2892 domain-containing protein, partial [Alicyclobacillus shizuokensis]|nr:DUF2892 domain-containing protein [Alicyclobacillus shizuokensis]